MASVTSQKQAQKEWLIKYFEEYIANMELDALREFAMWCVYILMASMSLPKLKEWRAKLERKE